MSKKHQRPWIRHRRRWAFGLTVLAALGPSQALAGERIAGPVAATVVRVVDGDTLTVEAAIWIGQRLTVNARIRGIDTPELRGACPREKTLAGAARIELRRMVDARTVQLTNVENDKFGGRVVADVHTVDGDLGTHMIVTGHARAYDGGRRGSWCAAAS